MPWQATVATGGPTNYNSPMRRIRFSGSRPAFSFRSRWRRASRCARGTAWRWRWKARRRRRRLGAAKGRQRRRRRGRDGLRDGGHASLRRQSRRRRLHADPLRRRPHDVHRFPRDGAGEGDAQHVSRRQGRADERQHRRLAIVGRAGHRARFRDGGRRSTASRTWAENMAPAIELARRASRCRTRWPKSLKGSTRLGEDPGVEAHLPEERRVLRGRRDARRSPSWPRRSSASRRTAPNEFYEGETAKRFAAEMAKHGGIITAADLKDYKAIERTPLKGKYTNYTVITAPPSSSGGIALLEMLGILEGTELREGRLRLGVAPFTTWPKRCAAPTPIATSTSAIRRS